MTKIGTELQLDQDVWVIDTPDPQCSHCNDKAAGGLNQTAIHCKVSNIHISKVHVLYGLFTADPKIHSFGIQSSQFPREQIFSSKKEALEALKEKTRSENDGPVFQL